MQRKHVVSMLMAVFFMAAVQAMATDFTLSSPQLEQGGTMGMEQVFSGFGCTGANVSPELNWSGAPAGTKSFAVTVYDPDAPTGSGWWHWLVFNIPATVHSLASDSGNPEKGLLPPGSVQSRTDYGKFGYGGACPPAGDKPHRYQFTVWALDTPELPLGQDVSAAMVGFYLHQHQLAKATMTVTYGR